MKTAAPPVFDASLSTSAPRTGVLVINLASATDRMSFQTEQMKRLGLKARRIEAVSKANIDAAELQNYSRKAVRPFAGSELACLLSHARCWEAVVEAGTPMLIVEDDVVLSEHLPQVLDELARLQPESVINLETYLDRPKFLSRRPVTMIGDGLSALYTVIKGSAGAAAYVLGPHAAQRLLTALNTDAALADAFLGLNTGRRNFQTVPALAAQMMTLETCYGRSFGAASKSNIGAGIATDAPSPKPRGLQRYLANPGFAKRRLLLELRVAFEKLEGALFGQKMTIQPCPSLLAKRA